MKITGSVITSSFLPFPLFLSTSQTRHLKAIHNYKVKRCMDSGMNKAAAETFSILVMLDAWSVNRTAAMREFIKNECPGMLIMWIPAGATGLYQINDTHVHRPFKAAVRAACEAWYRESVIQIDAKRKDVELTDDEYHTNIASLTSKSTLRDHTAAFFLAGVKRITEVPAGGGYNVVKRGFYDIYFKHADDPDFVVKAMERRAARSQEAEEKLAADVAQMEAGLHDGEVPKGPKPHPPKTGKQRKGHAGAQHAAAKAAAAAAAELASAVAGEQGAAAVPAAAVAGKKRKRGSNSSSAAAAAGGSKSKKKRARRAAASSDDDDDDSVEEQEEEEVEEEDGGGAASAEDEVGEEAGSSSSSAAAATSSSAAAAAARHKDEEDGADLPGGE
jgi:hypothetical protein